MCVYVCVYTHTYIYTDTHTYLHWIILKYSAIKKNEILPFSTTWIDLKGNMLNEISLMEKDKYFMISLINRI